MEYYSEDERRATTLQPTQPPPSSADSLSSANEVSSDLEKVLSDTELPSLKRLRLATWIELKLLFRLAGPAIGVYLINNIMSLSTRSFAGHLGTLELAAASLGNQGVQLFAYGLMVIN
jgi:multidrug resistance protein, MATE family